MSDTRPPRASVGPSAGRIHSIPRRGGQVTEPVAAVSLDGIPGRRPVDRADDRRRPPSPRTTVQQHRGGGHWT